MVPIAVKRIVTKSSPGMRNVSFGSSKAEDVLLSLWLTPFAAGNGLQKIPEENHAVIPSHERDPDHRITNFGKDQDHQVQPSTLTLPISHVLQCHISVVLQHLQGQ